MWDRIWRGPFLAKRQAGVPETRPANRIKRRPTIEGLETRQLLTASLAPLQNITVPQQLGYQVPLDGSGSNSPNQQFTVTSDNPSITASVAQGPYWTVNVSHQAAPSEPTDITFSGALTFQLFQDLTPDTVAHITQFTNNGYYTGKDFTRIINNFPGTTDYVAQGGAVNPDGTGNSGQPGTPFNDEFVQQLAFTGRNQLAMANSGPNTNDTQFFVATGSPQFLNFKHTIFGQLVSGTATLAKMTQVATKANPALNGEKSLPVSPIVIDSATLSTANPNGVIHINTNSAKSGDTAKITVTATDPSDNSKVTESFTVTVGAYSQPSAPPINFVPFANDTSASTLINTPTQVQLAGQSGYPDATKPATLTYQLLSQPTHGTISQFNSSTGTFTYTPNQKFLGSDTFQYQVTSTGPQSSPASLTSLPGTVSIQVGAGNTGAVRLIGRVLVVTPPPRSGHGTDTIQVTQVADSKVAGGNKLEVLVNGVPDSTQPSITLVDQIVVFGNKANNKISIDPNVTIPATLDGGHGGRNLVTAGGGSTREHGWFGHTTLVGGSGPNQLVGRAGVVRFRPTKTSNLIFVGVPKPRHHNRTVPPGGTFYRFVKGRLVPVAKLG